mmetsp:Transcript_7555/g.13961  ORF Transcript_7555/g.13961 Transcript_7555/m.13961 type:complete len:89 (-) Transcript_7555:346-612(-)
MKIAFAMSVAGALRHLLNIPNHLVDIGSRVLECGSRRCVSHACVSPLKEDTKTARWYDHLVVIGHSQMHTVGAGCQTKGGTPTYVWCV